MRFVPRRSTRCADARARISLLADDELSDFERRHLSRHLRDCAECSAFKSDISAVVHALRSAPLELMTKPIGLPQRERPRLRRVRFLAPAAALVLVAVGGVGALDSVHGTQLAPLGVVGGTPAAVIHGSRIVPDFTATGRLVAQ